MFFDQRIQLLVLLRDPAGTRAHAIQFTAALLAQPVSDFAR
jgi:hypothetical protein